MSDSFDPYKEWLGIELEDQPADYYRLLSVARFEADTHVISVAADQRMSHIRSFQTGPRGKYTQPLLNEIALARRTLLNAEKRAQYDKQLREEADLDIDVDQHLPPGVPSTSGGQMTAEWNSGHAPPAALPGHAPAAALPGHGPAAALPGHAPPAALPGHAPPAALPGHGPAAALPESVASPAAPTIAVDAELPRSVGPPTSATAAAVPTSAAATPSLMRQWSRKQSSSPTGVVVALVLGVLIVAAAVWAVGTYWKRGDQQTTAKPTGPSQPQQRAKKGLQLKVQGKRPAVEVMQEGTGDVNLSAAVAGLHGPNIDLLARGEFDILGQWTSADDWATWQFKIFQPGVFQMTITYQVPDGGGGSYEVLLDGERVKETATRNGAPGFITDEMHLAVTKRGSHVLSIRPTGAPSQELMVLKTIKLISRSKAR